MKTRAACLETPEKVVLKERDLEPGEDEVLVRTYQASICGTDKNFYRGNYPSDFSLPCFMGHEGGGIVEAVGTKVHEYGVGDKVISFGWCDTFADYFKTQVLNLQPVPMGLDLEIASLGEPIACAIYSAYKSGIELGDTVAIFGMGFAGLIILQAVWRKGANKVIAIDPVEDKLKLASKWGATITVNPQKENVIERIKEITKGRGVDVAFEVAGAEEALNQATTILKPNGILVLYSWITQPVTLNISRWHHEGFDIRTTTLAHHTREERLIWAEHALRPVVLGLIEIKPLITHRFSLADIARAFQVADQDPTAIKVIIKP